MHREIRFDRGEVSIESAQGTGERGVGQAAGGLGGALVLRGFFVEMPDPAFGGGDALVEPVELGFGFGECFLFGNDGLWLAGGGGLEAFASEVFDGEFDGALGFAALG